MAIKDSHPISQGMIICGMKLSEEAKKFLRRKQAEQKEKELAEQDNPAQAQQHEGIEDKSQR